MSDTAPAPKQPEKSSQLAGCRKGCGILLAGVIILTLIILVGSSFLPESETDDPPDQGSGAPASTEMPTQRQSATEVPQAALNPASGGLGLTGSEWRAVHGEPTGTGASTSFAEEGWRVDHLEFAEDTQPWNFTIRLNEPVDLATAQAIAAQYIPTDATVVEEYPRPEDDSDVVLYHSEWLAGAMDGPWLDAEPGPFLAVYGWEGDDRSTGIIYILIATSHNP